MGISVGSSHAGTCAFTKIFTSHLGLVFSVAQRNDVLNKAEPRMAPTPRIGVTLGA